MLKILDLNLDIQTKFKATRQKLRLVEPTEKIPSTTIMKGDDGRSRSKSRSSLLLEKVSLVFFFLTASGFIQS